MYFVNDEVCNVPLLSRLTGDHPWKYRLLRVCRSNYLIVQVEDDETITGEHLTDTLNLLQSSGVSNITIGLVKRTQSTVGTLAKDQEKCDQIETSKHELLHCVVPTSHFLVSLPLPIKAPKDITHILKDKNFYLQKAVIYEQYDKNHKLLLLFNHFPVHHVPSEHQVCNLC